MTWKHIDLHGEYDFNLSDKRLDFDIEKTLEFKLLRNILYNF